MDYSCCTDENLFVLYRTTKDNEAFQALVERHEARLIRYARLLLGEEEAAKDAVQETWIELHRGGPAELHDGSIRAWLYRVVTSKCTDEHRRRKRRPAVGNDIPEPESREPRSGSALERNESLRHVYEFVQKVPEHTRITLVLKLQGCSNSEAARLQGITPPAVTRHLAVIAEYFFREFH